MGGGIDDEDALRSELHAGLRRTPIASLKEDISLPSERDRGFAVAVEGT